MKTNVLHILLQVIMLAALLVLNACDNDSKITQPVSTKSKDIIDVASYKGVLVFRDHATFNNYVNTTRELDLQEKLAFEKKYNFTSLLSHCKELNESKLGQAETSTLVKQLADGYQVDFFDFGIAGLIDKDGYVIIGGLLYQFSNENIKGVQLQNNKLPFPKLKSYLASVTQTDKAKGLFVSPVKSLPIPKLDAKTNKNAREGLFGLRVLDSPQIVPNSPVHRMEIRFHDFEILNPIYDFDDYDCDHPGRVYDSSMGLCWPIIIGYGTPYRGIAYTIYHSTRRYNNNSFSGNSLTMLTVANFDIYINNVATFINSQVYTGQYGYIQNGGSLYSNLNVPATATVEIDGYIYYQCSESNWISTSGSVTH